LRPDAAYRLLQRNHDARARPSSESSSQDGGRNLLPALATAFSAYEYARKRPRGASHAHPKVLAPAPFSPACAGLRRRYVHSASANRQRMARAERPSEGRTTISRYFGAVPRFRGATWAACAWRRRKAFPSLAYSRTPVVIGAFGNRAGGSYHPCGSRRRITDRSRSSFRRHPAKEDGFQRTWVPFTVCETPRTRGSLLVPMRFGLPLTPPTLLVFYEGAFFGALQAPLHP